MKEELIRLALNDNLDHSYTENDVYFYDQNNIMLERDDNGEAPNVKVKFNISSSDKTYHDIFYYSDKVEEFIGDFIERFGVEIPVSKLNNYGIVFSLNDANLMNNPKSSLKQLNFNDNILIKVADPNNIFTKALPIKNPSNFVFNLKIMDLSTVKIKLSKNITVSDLIKTFKGVTGD